MPPLTPPPLRDISLTHRTLFVLIESINFYLNSYPIVLIGLSATCYCIAFSPSWWWASLVWPSLLWKASFSKRLSGSWAVFWALIALGGNLSGFFQGIYAMISASWLMSITAPSLFLGYHVLLCSAWLICTDLLAQKLLHCKTSFFSLWALSTWCYCIFLNNISLAPCGLIEGCGVCSPLIPLIHIPNLLWPLRVLGEYGMLGLWVGTQALVMADHWPLVLGVLLIWITGAAYEGITVFPSAMPQYVPLLAIVRAQFSEQRRSQARAHIMAHVNSVCQTHQQCGSILFPESAVHRYNVFPSERGGHVSMPNSYRGTIVIGGFRKVHNYVHNTLWFLHNGRVIDLFDKQHALPFTERLPWWGNYCGLTGSLFAAGHEITAAHNVPRPHWEIMPGLSTVPYICSELFLSHHPRDSSSLPILALCNSSWLPPRTQLLMAQTAAYKAVLWQRVIIYVAHAHSAVMMPSGQRYPIYEEEESC